MDLVTSSICFGAIIPAEVIPIYIGFSLAGYTGINGLSSIKFNLLALPAFLLNLSYLLHPSPSFLPDYFLLLTSLFPFLISHLTSGLSSRLLTVSLFLSFFFL